MGPIQPKNVAHKKEMQHNKTTFSGSFLLHITTIHIKKVSFYKATRHKCQIKP